jgi:hypothetical protein
MTIYYIFGVAALVAVVGILRNLVISGKLNERSMALDQREARIEDKEEWLQASILAQRELEAQTRALYVEQKAIDEQETYQSSYVITESDMIKYTTDKAVYANAKNRIAMNIANDIVRKFEPSVERAPGGRLKYVYKFKVVEGK